MNAWSLQQWIGVVIFILGMACLCSLGRMGRLLPKPWTGKPQQWLPEYRRILKRSLIILGLGALLLLVGITVFVRP